MTTTIAPPAADSIQATVPARHCVNLGCGKLLRESTAEERWDNVDRLRLPGVSQIIDLFCYPWPWPSGSYDHIYAGHLIEHIPHDARLSVEIANMLAQNGSIDPGWLAKIAPLDGFFAFFAEAWRILRPGGTIECECPWGLSSGAIMDPTHTRQIIGQTLGYLTGEGSATFDYHLPFSFSICGPIAYAPSAEYADSTPEEIMIRAGRMFNVILTIRFTLRREELGESVP